MLTLFKNMHQDFRTFLKENNKPIMAAFVFSLISFGFMLTHYSLTIDEETWINNTNSSAINLWLIQSRFGIYLFDKIFTPLGRYIPFLWDFLAVVFWSFAGIVFSFCLTMLTKSRGRFSVFAFTAMFSSIPLVVGELLSFSLFNVQQSLSMMIMAFSVCALFRFFKEEKKGLLVLSSILIFISSSFFQAFPTVFISAVVAYCVFYIKEEISPDYKLLFKNILYSIGVLLIGVGCFYGVNKVITCFVAPGGGTYLDRAYIGWNLSSGFADPFFRTLKNNLIILLGHNIVGGTALLCTFILFSLFVLFAVARRKGVANKFLLLIFSGILILSPFSLSFLFAMPNIVGRTYLALPFVYGVMVYLITDIKQDRRWIKTIISTLVLLILIKNAATMNTYFYNSYMVYQNDKTFAQSVMQTVNSKGYDYRQKKIVFIGKYDSGIVRQDCSPAFGSFFNWDEGNITRMTDFLNAEGYSVIKPSTEDIADALEISREMPCWPQQGCVTEENTVIIIKLSDVSNSPVWYMVNGIKK